MVPKTSKYPSECEKGQSLNVTSNHQDPKSSFVWIKINLKFWIVTQKSSSHFPKCHCFLVLRCPQCLCPPLLNPAVPVVWLSESGPDSTQWSCGWRSVCPAFSSHSFSMCHRNSRSKKAKTVTILQIMVSYITLHYCNFFFTEVDGTVFVFVMKYNILVTSTVAPLISTLNYWQMILWRLKNYLGKEDFIF